MFNGTGLLLLALTSLLLILMMELDSLVLSLVYLLKFSVFLLTHRL